MITILEKEYDGNPYYEMETGPHCFRCDYAGGVICHYWEAHGITKSGCDLFAGSEQECIDEIAELELDPINPTRMENDFSRDNSTCARWRMNTQGLAYLEKDSTGNQNHFINNNNVSAVSPSICDGNSSALFNKALNNSLQLQNSFMSADFPWKDQDIPVYDFTICGILKRVSTDSNQIIIIKTDGVDIDLDFFLLANSGDMRSRIGKAVGYEQPADFVDAFSMDTALSQSFSLRYRVDEKKLALRTWIYDTDTLFFNE